MMLYLLVAVLVKTDYDRIAIIVVGAVCIVFIIGVIVVILLLKKRYAQFTVFCICNYTPFVN